MNRLNPYEEQFQFFHAKQGVAIKKQVGKKSSYLDILELSYRFQIKHDVSYDS